MQPQEIFGNYLLLEEIHRDGLQTSWRACSIVDGKTAGLCLLQLYDGDQANREEIASSIDRQNRLERRMTAPGFGQLLDCGQVSGTPYVAYQYVSAFTFAEVVERLKTRSRGTGADIALLMTERMGLLIGAAWNTAEETDRLPHGFLSSHQVLVSHDGEVIVTGFSAAPGNRQGLATSPERHRLTGGEPTSEALFVTEFDRYLSPTALSGEPIEPRDDVYSLGVLLYELLSGMPLQSPRDGGRADAIANLNLNAETTQVAESIRSLLRDSLGEGEKPFATVSSWRNEVSRILDASGHHPTTFNIAFLLHSLFGDEIAQESRCVQRDSVLIGTSVTMPEEAVAAPSATPFPEIGLASAPSPASEVASEPLPEPTEEPNRATTFDGATTEADAPEFEAPEPQEAPVEQPADRPELSPSEPRAAGTAPFGELGAEPMAPEAFEATEGILPAEAVTTDPFTAQPVAAGPDPFEPVDTLPGVPPTTFEYDELGNPMPKRLSAAELLAKMASDEPNVETEPPSPDPSYGVETASPEPAQPFYNSVQTQPIPVERAIVQPVTVQPITAQPVAFHPVGDREMDLGGNRSTDLGRDFATQEIAITPASHSIHEPSTGVAVEAPPMDPFVAHNATPEHSAQVVDLSRIAAELAAPTPPSAPTPEMAPKPSPPKIQIHHDTSEDVYEDWFKEPDVEIPPLAKGTESVAQGVTASGATGATAIDSAEWSEFTNETASESTQDHPRTCEDKVQYNAEGFTPEPDGAADEKREGSATEVALEADELVRPSDPETLEDFDELALPTSSKRGLYAAAVILVAALVAGVFWIARTQPISGETARPTLAEAPRSADEPTTEPTQPAPPVEEIAPSAGSEEPEVAAELNKMIDAKTKVLEEQLRQEYEAELAKLRSEIAQVGPTAQESIEPPAPIEYAQEADAGDSEFVSFASPVSSAHTPK